MNRKLLYLISQEILSEEIPTFLQFEVFVKLQVLDKNLFLKFIIQTFKTLKSLKSYKVKRLSYLYKKLKKLYSTYLKASI